jgi:hypothetical protein
MNASSRCCPAVRMPPRDQDVHHRRSYRDRRGTFRTLAHPAAAGWSLIRSQGRHWRMTEQDNADALDGFPCRQYGAPRSDVTQPEAGGQVTTQGTGLPTKSALRATSPGDRYSRRTPAMLVPLWPHRLRLHPIMLSRRTVGHPRPAAPADERPLPRRMHLCAYRDDDPAYCWRCHVSRSPDTAMCPKCQAAEKDRPR